METAGDLGVTETSPVSMLSEDKQSLNESNENNEFGKAPQTNRRSVTFSTDVHLHVQSVDITSPGSDVSSSLSSSNNSSISSQGTNMSRSRNAFSDSLQRSAMFSLGSIAEGSREDEESRASMNSYALVSLPSSTGESSIVVAPPEEEQEDFPC